MPRDEDEEDEEDEDEEDEDEEDEDEEDEDEEEDDSLTLQDVKDAADTVKSIAEAGKAIKEFTTPRPPMGNLGSPGRPSEKEIEDAIRDAKEKAVPRMWVKGSTKTPPPKPPPKTTGTKNGESAIKHFLKGTGKWIVGILSASIILYYVWPLIASLLP